MIEAHGNITADDYVRAQRLHLRPRPLFRVIGLAVVGLFVLALVAASWSAFQAGSVAGALPLLLLSAYFLFLFFVWLPFRSRRLYKQQKTLQVPFTFRLDDGGLTMESELGASMLPWGLLHRWKENRHLFLIYHAGNIFTPLPKSLLTPETALAVRSILQAHLRNAT